MFLNRKVQCSGGLRGMSALKTASSSPLRTFALVSISSGRVSEKGDTRNAAEIDRSVISPSVRAFAAKGQGRGGSPTLWS